MRNAAAGQIRGIRGRRPGGAAARSVELPAGEAPAVAAGLGRSTLDGMELHEECAQLAERIGEHARTHDLHIAAAESLTGGILSMHLSAAPQASTWYAGAVVAYESETKFRVLDVDRGPVVTERCALQMARGVSRLLGANAAIATTGVGGPDPDEGLEPGSTWIAVLLGDREWTSFHRFDGEPEDVLRQTAVTALQAAADALADYGAQESGS
ncbi:hypothetical protein GCM10027079_06970 [Sediminivirga luteola]|uniref:CinA C-terminal domain-containing protein n=2 Tax=Sediminivirga luteola TaxID=1774748 RepID=A0A8J2U112_9MICO|nr:hypothetical protein GCM10011333_32270 [Sediminivirga luteola]